VFGSSQESRFVCEKESDEHEVLGVLIYCWVFVSIFPCSRPTRILVSSLYVFVKKRCWFRDDFGFVQVPRRDVECGVKSAVDPRRQYCSYKFPVVDSGGCSSST